MTLQFRNIDAMPDDPVAEWGFEGILTALERGDVVDWHELYAACSEDSTGDIRRRLDEALDILSTGDIHPQLAAVFRIALSKRCVK